MSDREEQFQPLDADELQLVLQYEPRMKPAVSSRTDGSHTNRRRLSPSCSNSPTLRASATALAWPRRLPLRLELRQSLTWAYLRSLSEIRQ